MKAFFFLLVICAFALSAESQPALRNNPAPKVVYKHPKDSILHINGAHYDSSPGAMRKRDAVRKAKKQKAHIPARKTKVVRTRTHVELTGTGHTPNDY